ncbi:MAG: helix-turn-helix transcriptional regulator [Clostridiales bacterium]|nr:helix-turn-helix transcriptional regulator [Clostridiales bacterium]
MSNSTTKIGTKNLIGFNIRNIRLKMDMSQRDFAEFLQCHGLDMSKSTITHIETKKRRITDYEIREFCRILQVSYDTLFDI